MTFDELKLRRLTEQYLIQPSSKYEVVKNLCGIQAQFFSYSVHAVKIRANDFNEATFADGLVRNWTLRGTMHLLLEEDLPLFKHDAQYRFVRLRDTLEGDEHISAERKKYFADIIIDSIKQGVNEREMIKQRCFALGMTAGEAKSVFDPWGGLTHALCDSGIMSYTAEQAKKYKLVKPYMPMKSDEAQLEIARRYFTHYAPVTLKDAAYFFKKPQAKIKEWLRKLPVEIVNCSNKTYYYIDSGNSYDHDIPACIFLAGFDPLMLGYEKTDSPFLPHERLRGIYTLTGIVLPSILLHGKVIGKWQRKGKKLVCTLFERITAKDKRHITDTAEKLWGAGVNIVFEA